MLALMASNLRYPIALIFFGLTYGTNPARHAIAYLLIVPMEDTGARPSQTTLQTSGEVVEN